MTNVLIHLHTMNRVSPLVYLNVLENGFVLSNKYLCLTMYLHAYQQFADKTNIKEAHIKL